MHRQSAYSHTEGTESKGAGVAGTYVIYKYVLSVQYIYSTPCTEMELAETKNEGIWMKNYEQTICRNIYLGSIELMSTLYILEHIYKISQYSDSRSRACIVKTTSYVRDCMYIIDKNS